MDESTTSPRPRGNAAGFRRHFRQDFLSGFLVFLIALPLCLGIALASGFPPLAGIFTAIIGSFLTIFISDSELTIKGPAAGLIVIVLGCVSDFGGDGSVGGFTDADFGAYRAALAVGAVAAVLQVAFGLLRAGIIGDFFPLAAVKGMLAAIGIIIMLKQIPVALGVDAEGSPLELLLGLPQQLADSNPAIAAIGGVSLLIMFLWPHIGRLLGERGGWLRATPAPLVVLLAAVPMGLAIGLGGGRTYVFRGDEFALGEEYLVAMPDRAFGMFAEWTTPDFSALASPKAWKWVLMFFLIGSLETLLSAKAVDLLDPFKRRADMDRDMVAVGVGNVAASCVGGMPMISEIVRSRANIDSGARTRFAGMWHGMFLLFCVALLPALLHRIPLAALAAMLVYTGHRLAHPSAFLGVYRTGRGQLLVFVVTIAAVLATDILVGICAGMVMNALIYVLGGIPMGSLFRTQLDVEPLGQGACVVRVRESAIFSNWIPVRRRLEELGLTQGLNITLDLSATKLVDYTVKEKLRAMQSDFEEHGLALTIVGQDHPLSRPGA